MNPDGESGEYMAETVSSSRTVGSGYDSPVEQFIQYYSCCWTEVIPASLLVFKTYVVLMVFLIDFLSNKVSLFFLLFCWVVFIFLGPINGQEMSANGAQTPKIDSLRLANFLRSAGQVYLHTSYPLWVVCINLQCGRSLTVLVLSNLNNLPK